MEPSAQEASSCGDAGRTRRPSVPLVHIIASRMATRKLRVRPSRSPPWREDSISLRSQELLGTYRRSGGSKILRALSWGLTTTQWSLSAGSLSFLTRPRTASADRRPSPADPTIVMARGRSALVAGVSLARFVVPPRRPSSSSDAPTPRQGSSGFGPLSWSCDGRIQVLPRPRTDTLSYRESAKCQRAPFPPNAVQRPRGPLNWCFVERMTGFEPATSTLARLRSSQLSYIRRATYCSDRARPTPINPGRIPNFLQRRRSDASHRRRDRGVRPWRGRPRSSWPWSCGARRPSCRRRVGRPRGRTGCRGT